MRDAIFRILALTRKELLTILKDPRSRFSLLVPPILQSLIFGYAATYDLNDVPYVVLDRDKTAASQELLAGFEGSPVFRRVADLERTADIKAEIDERRALLAIQIESGFEPHARSSKGAKGLMQLMPATARDMGARNVLDPRQNIFAGARYLRLLLDVFDGGVTLASAAYNAGPTTVQRYGGVPPFRETRDYVEKVHALLGLDPPNLSLPPTLTEVDAFLKDTSPQAY